MKYYITSDVHGFYDELIKELTKVGFFNDEEPHKLIICGDLFDRGKQAKELEKFILELMEKDEVILIRGNHEDLTIEMLEDLKYCGLYNLSSHHFSNGTVDTLLQLNSLTEEDIQDSIRPANKMLNQCDFVKKIIPATKDYFETDHYIFVHGWIPYEDIFLKLEPSVYAHYFSNWRTATKEAWERARWANGMYLWSLNVKEPNKTIVCGHWHSSWGHLHIHRKGTEFGAYANFEPFVDEGIIALDACTAYSEKINIIVLND